MLSDRLNDAQLSIRNCLESFPKAYSGIVDRVERLLIEMEGLRHDLVASGTDSTSVV
jgi:hypothetical protein